MKKLLSILACVLLAFVAILPVGVAISAVFGYRFSLFNDLAFVISALGIAAILAVLTFVTKEQVENAAIQVVFSLITPLSLFGIIFYVSSSGSQCLLLNAVLCVVCAYLTIQHGNPLSIKAGSLVTAASLLLPVCFICAILLAVNSAKVDTVVKTVDSPDGSAYVTVIHSDQGGDAGNTFVKAWEKKGFDAFLFKTEKKPILIYTGAKTEHETIEVVWNSDETVLINGNQYRTK